MSDETPPGRSNAPVELGYSFVALPERVVRAMADGELSHAEVAALAYLYGRASRVALAARKPTPRLSLGQIADGIRWSGKPESLQRFLRRLRDERRWFDFETDGSARAGFVYVFTLYPDEPGEPCPSAQSGTVEPDAAVSAESLSVKDAPESLSVTRPSKNGAARPSKDTTESRMVAPSAAASDGRLSVNRDPLASEPCPSIGVPCPSIEEAANDGDERDCAISESALVRESSEVSERAKAPLRPRDGAGVPRAPLLPLARPAIGSACGRGHDCCRNRRAARRGDPPAGVAVVSPSVSIESASSAKAPADDFDAWMVALPLLSGEGRSPTKLQKPRARLPLLRSAALSHTPRTRRPRELEATR